MVDFKKLRESKHQVGISDPIEIFRRMPKPAEIKDLYTSQAQVLEQWYKNRDKNDTVIKLHTGGGKTLVGLLIAQSILNETREPVIYLCPNNQLVEQTLQKASLYGIPAVPYEKGVDFDDRFLTGRSVLICNYHAMFNGLSRFGVRGNGKDIISAGAIILDDAHASFPIVRESFTMKIDSNDYYEAYSFLTNLFRNDFQEIGKQGTYDDIVSGSDFGILEVPYWSWKNKSSQVHDYIRQNLANNYRLVWPLIRDSFDYCHALISKNSFVITPLFPLVDMIPTFYDCKRRIFMSATIGDDSAIIRTFEAQYEYVSTPLSSNSLAGVSERMILAPELTKIDLSQISNILYHIVNHIKNNKQIGVSILVPSETAAEKWMDVATYARNSDEAREYIKQLQNGHSYGPYIFANRYDGIDLPDDACRLLIFSGLPKGNSEYDSYLANTFMNSDMLNTSMAQRIEQGIGRGARGPGDYCVVIITGKDLVSWISKSANNKFLTSSTQAQIRMGKEISSDIQSAKELWDTINRCLNRDKDWIEYHAETLADYGSSSNINHVALKLASTERKAFRLFRDGYYDKAISALTKYCELDGKSCDKYYLGWVFQYIARISHYWNNRDLAQKYQQQAYASNRNLFRPQTDIEYTPLIKPGKQAETIVDRINEYAIRRGLLSEFEEITSHLVPEASSNQFEQAFSDLGDMLGFSTERPDNSYGNGPDVLWLIDEKTALVIEAKSRKNKGNALTRDNHGQLLQAYEWFKEKYPSFIGYKIVIHPNDLATRSTTTGETRALTYTKLNELLSDARALFSELCDSSLPADKLMIKCETLLSKSNLNSKKLVINYFVPFEVQ